MIVGGVLGALGLAVLVVARGRIMRLAALGAVIVGGFMLVVTLRPEGMPIRFCKAWNASFAMSGSMRSWASLTSSSLATALTP